MIGTEVDNLIERGESQTVSDEATTVTVTKIFTPAGECLEITAPNAERTVRLDALELETLTWQEHDAYLTFLDNATDVQADLDARRRVIEAWIESDDETADKDDAPVIIDPEDRNQAITISNEFSEIHIRVREGESDEMFGRHQLLLLAPKLDYRTSVIASELETVTWQTPDVYSEFLETPYGPH